MELISWAPVASGYYSEPFDYYGHWATNDTGNGQEEAMAGDEYSFHNGGGPAVEAGKETN